ncbi:hypothetical protein Hs30E_13330 [Lactococcus hodotermopsidis]|uniref:Uncharacterized protein n=1 Tax=Pseudolactococcus hodotermopsidis TaxID=2709157 RepID=A0A6A0BBR6_9LACT|nr:hypothetical protein [Lactococcus hodotermopsidis]GFH42782.1 hypothetical protein Hs30E_13330 [Lactococcus hodotermopsidis]
MKKTVNFKIMNLVADAYMNDTTARVAHEGDLLSVTIKKANSDLVQLFVNYKQVMTVRVKGTRSHIISVAKENLEHLNYVLPFAKSLGLSEATTRRYLEIE